MQGYKTPNETIGGGVRFTLHIDRPVLDLIELVNQAYETPAIAYWVDETIDKSRAPKGTYEFEYVYKFTIKTDDDTYEINVNTIRDGINAIVKGNVKVADYIKDYILRYLTDGDLGHIDSDALDVIVQAGLFKDVIFG